MLVAGLRHRYWWTSPSTVCRMGGSEKSCCTEWQQPLQVSIQAMEAGCRGLALRHYIVDPGHHSPASVLVRKEREPFCSILGQLGRSGAAAWTACSGLGVMSLVVRFRLVYFYLTINDSDFGASWPRQQLKKVASSLGQVAFVDGCRTLSRFELRFYCPHEPSSSKPL